MTVDYFRISLTLPPSILCVFFCFIFFFKFTMIVSVDINHNLLLLGDEKKPLSIQRRVLNRKKIENWQSE